MAKIEIDQGIFEYNDFTSKKAFKLKTKWAQEQDLFHIISHPNFDNQMILGVNGDNFYYYENLTTGEIEYDECDWGEVDPVHLKIELLQLAWELSSNRAT